LGEKDKASRELENAFEDRDGYSVTFIKVDPMLDPCAAIRGLMPW
jgi:hypothetical protein